MNLFKDKKLCFFSILATVFILNSYVLAGDPVWSDNFDYPAGQTLEDNGWVLSVEGEYGQQGLDSTVFVSSPNSLTQWTIPYADPQMIFAKHSFESLSKGSVSLYMRTSHSDVPPDLITARFYITSDTGTIAQFQFAAQWGIYINGTVPIGAFNANQWYHVEMSWDDSTKRVSVTVDGVGTAVANYNDAAAAGANQIEILNNSPSDPDKNVQTWYDDVVVQRLCAEYHTGDFNQDCVVDTKDLATFITQWLECTDETDINCIWP